MSSPSSADAPALPLAQSLAIHLDLVGGLAGDMFVAAMIDALPALEEPVQRELAKVRPEGGGLPVFDQTQSGALRARRLTLASQAATRSQHHGTSYAALRRTIAE